MFSDARAELHATGDGYLTICGLSPIPVETWAQWFKENIQSIKTPVIASIMAVTVEGYAKAAKMLQEAGAQAIEILLKHMIKTSSISKKRRDNPFLFMLNKNLP